MHAIVSYILKFNQSMLIQALSCHLSSLSAASNVQYRIEHLEHGYSPVSKIALRHLVPVQPFKWSIAFLTKCSIHRSMSNQLVSTKDCVQCPRPIQAFNIPVLVSLKVVLSQNIDPKIQQSGHLLF